jgi:hypothetical protein
MRAQRRLDATQEAGQHRIDRFGLALQEVAQALGHRQHPVAHRQRWKDMIDKMRGGLGSSSCFALPPASLQSSALAPASPYLLRPCSRRLWLLLRPTSCVPAVVGHAPRVPGRANRPCATGDGDDEVRAARRASRPPETSGQDATVEVLAEIALHERRHRLVPRLAGRLTGQPVLEVMLRRLVERRALRSSRTVAPGPWRRAPVVGNTSIAAEQVSLVGNG